MGRLLEIVTPLHKATKRDYLARMNDDKVHCMVKAKEYEFDYWDGDRRYGYGGYKFIDGRWKPVAQAFLTSTGIERARCRRGEVESDALDCIVSDLGPKHSTRGRGGPRSVCQLI